LELRSRETGGDKYMENLLIALAVTGCLAWWLSGYDAKVTGDNETADLKRRLARSAVTMLLVGLGVGAASGGSRFGGLVFIAIVLPVAILWTGCVSELFARAAHGLIDSHDPTPCDLNKTQRDLDRLASLVQQNRNEDALELCVALLKSGETSAVAMQTQLARIYDQMFSDQRLAGSETLAQAERFRLAGRITGTAVQVNQRFKSEPENLAAILALVRAYACELDCPSKAETLLGSLEQNPGIPPGFTDYARHRLTHWLSAPAQAQKGAEAVESLLVHPPAQESREPTAPASDSVHELLETGRFGTAIEILEKNLAEKPLDFDLWLGLAEAHGLYCRNFDRAGKILAKMEKTKAFTPEQIQRANQKLESWRTQKV
jgi:hypothetical protein